MRRLLFTVALSVVIAAPALAQQPLKLSFENGRVTVDATSVPVRTILTEWGKVGGTKVVGAERISGAPMTLKLVSVTEAQALETILRSVAGYMAAPRSGATTGPSIYDRILVMATSSAPAPPATAARPSPAQPNAVTGTQRFVPPRQRAEEPEEVQEPDDNQPSPPVFTFPQTPQNMGYPQQPAGGYVPAGVAQPGMIVPAPQTITINPAQGTPVPQPQLPIGVPKPGMMVPVPPPVTTPTGTTVIRPPGR